MTKRILVACCSPISDPAWRWIADELDSERYDWRFFNTAPRDRFERWLTRPDTARLRACWQTARCERHQAADLIVTHQPLVGCWTELFRQRLGATCPHVAFSFNFTALPRGLRRWLMTKAARTIDRFVVFSQFERDLYSRYFHISTDRIDVIPWGVREPPSVSKNRPLETGEYLCSVGSQGRDYATLLEAMRRIPSIPLVLVAKPENVASLEIPDNVRLRLQIPLQDVYNVVGHSRFLVLPLAGSEVPCGHVTLVTAMYLGRAIVATDSVGISDYVQPGVNAVTCPASDPQALADRISQLWEDRTLCSELGDAGRQFALANCTERATVAHFERIVTELFGSGNPAT